MAWGESYSYEYSIKPILMEYSYEAGSLTASIDGVITPIRGMG